MSSKEVVLDRTGILQIAGAMASLAVLGFVAGAVVGFALHGGAGVPPEVSSDDSAPASRAIALAPPECLPVAASAQPLQVALAPPLERGKPAEPNAAAEPPGAAQPTPAVDRGARPDAVPTQERRATGGFAVQVGVFGVEANANRMAVSLRERGYDPLVVAMRNRSGQWMQRVHLSVYASEDSALAAARSFTDREGMQAVVVAFREDPQ